ncbi:hypothetical protein N339_04836, partial [Pterocles gutturalis]
QAIKMQVLLPHIRKALKDDNTDIKMKVLVIFRKVLGHLERKEASCIAVELAEELLPLFDHECSQMRELSIGLFRDLVEAVVQSDKTKMNNNVQRGLIPLFLHMQEETDSVAK